LSFSTPASVSKSNATFRMPGSASVFQYWRLSISRYVQPVYLLLSRRKIVLLPEQESPCRMTAVRRRPAGDLTIKAASKTLLASLRNNLFHVTPWGLEIAFSTLLREVSESRVLGFDAPEETQRTIPFQTRKTSKRRANTGKTGMKRARITMFRQQAPDGAGPSATDRFV
jgi:hypothetical protein